MGEIVMEILQEKYDICCALNFNRYPVLHLDLAKDEINGMEGCYKGHTVKIEMEYKGEPLLYAGNLCYYDDTNQLVISSTGTFLKATFDYSDIIEMVDRAQAPTINSMDEGIVVVITNSEKRKSAFPVMTKLSSFNPNCQTMAVIEGDFKEIIEKLAS
jgi:hypothetical protein